MDLTLNVYDMEPIKFYPYAHSVRDRILTIDCGNSEEDQKYYLYWEKSLISLFNSDRIKAHPDNKIAFEVSMNGRILFIGFYDWKMSIGFRVDEV